jgi:hypothetical protein
MRARLSTKGLLFLLSLVAVLFVTASAAGTVQTLIKGKNIAPHSISSQHMVDHTLQAHDMSPALLKSLQGKTGATGQQGARGEQGTKGDKGDKGDSHITNLEADGPYPGSALVPLHGDQGGQSTAMWTHGTPTLLQQSWVMCAPGKVALGGGFGQNDLQSDQLVIVGSSPINVNAAGELYPAGSTPTDNEGSLLAPNGWLVQGYNQDPVNDLIVRPWVICANVK